MIDVCAGKHQGNLSSCEAFQRARHGLPESRRRVLEYIRSQGDYGATCAEVAEHMGVGMNAVSGRLTELKRDGQVLALVDEFTRLVRRQSRTGGWGQVFVANRLR